LSALLSDPEVKVDGLLLPGHVSSIIGLKPYELLKRFNCPGVVAGFEPLDILIAVQRLLEALNAGEARLENLYARAVPAEGNPIALKLFEELFETTDGVWRGIGTIPGSEYRLKGDYRYLDTATRFRLAPLSDRTESGCSCGQVLKGILLPDECPRFGNGCTPDHPVGPCMVSGEGSCAAAFKHRPGG